MVLIDGVKFACQSCIKGHRSSKCTHTTRPLQEIKKKGRPASQCAHCRELRKTKSVHARCDCAAREKEAKPAARLLPNGLSDAMLLASLADAQDDDGDSTLDGGPSASGSGLTRTEKSGVTRLLNPCNCLRGGKCTCCTADPVPSKKAFPGDELSTSASGGGGGCCGGGSANPAPAAAPVASTSGGGGCCGGGGGSASPIAPIFTDGALSPFAELDFDAGTTTFDLPVPPSLSLPGSFPSASVSTSSAPANGAPFAFPFTSDIPVFPSSLSPPLPSSSSSTPVPTPSSSTNPTLFTPRTHGTSSCFCGALCACVGCAVHDPLSRKRPAEGACAGGGCRCGEEGEEGCRGSGKKRRGEGPRKAGGCCGGGGAAVEENPPASTSGGGGGGCCGSKPPPVASSASTSQSSSCCSSRPAPSLPVSSFPSTCPPDAAAPALPPLPTLWPLDASSGDPSAPMSQSAALPSLRTLWPALLDRGDAQPPLEPFASAASVAPQPPVAESAASSGCCSSHPAPPPADGTSCCTDTLLVPSLTSSGELDLIVEEGCACTDACGCRAGADLASTSGSGSGASGEWVEVSGEEERMDEIARMAEGGMFG
ncbi:hypothetical protein JCM10207_000779 [Rhodosporidiobolus poonsookiae]